MITRIARKEFTEMSRDGRFRLAALMVFGLLLVSLLTGWKHYRDIKTQHELAQRETRDHWLQQGVKNPHSAAHYGVYAFKPKLPLSFADRGVDAFVGQAVWLEAHKQNDFKYRPAQDATAVARFGELTAATVLQLLLPLLIVLLSFAAFAGEREDGTLRQLLSLGVKKSDLALGKAAGITAALGLLLVPATVIGVIALGLASDNGSFTPSLPRLGLMIVGYLLYFGVFIGVSLTVSALASSARAALVILLGFWIMNGLIAPRAASDLARRLHPTPSSFEFAKAMQEDNEKGLDGHSPANKRAAEFKQAVLKQYGVTKEEELPISFAGLSLQQSEEEGNKVFDKHYARLWDAFQRQDRWQQTASIAAPLLAIRSLSMGLAGTDFAQHRSFAEAAEQYRRYFIKVANDDMTHNAKGKDFGYMADNDVWQRVKDFEYAAPQAGWVLRSQAISLLLLAVWFVAAMSSALWAAQRMKL